MNPAVVMNCNRALSKSKDTRGFTLVEVFIGLVLFSFVATALFQVIGQGLIIMAHARDVTRVTQVMQHQTETLRGTGWENIKSLSGTTTKIAVDANGIPTSGSGTTPFDWVKFELKQEVILEESDMYIVRLTATWARDSKKEYSRTFITRIAENGLNAYYIRTSS